MYFHGQLHNTGHNSCFIIEHVKNGANEVRLSACSVFVGEGLLFYVSDQVMLLAMIKNTYGLFRAQFLPIKDSLAKINYCVLTFHAIYTFLVANRSEEHWQ